MIKVTTVLIIIANICPERSSVGRRLGECTVQTKYQVVNVIIAESLNSLLRISDDS